MKLRASLPLAFAASCVAFTPLAIEEPAHAESRPASGETRSKQAPEVDRASAALPEPSGAASDRVVRDEAVREELVERSLRVAGKSAPGFERRFPFEDEVRLRQGEQESSLVYVPDAVPTGATVALVVFLHGINPNGPKHAFVGGSGERDLRPVVRDLVRRGEVGPLAIAAPSQTRQAGSSKTLWTDFALGPFVDAVEASLEGHVRIDRARVILVGHSGAGCNTNGGLLAAAADGQGVTPLAIVAVDTCLDANIGEGLTRAPSATRVWAYYQDWSWRRKFDAFRGAFLASDGTAANASEGGQTGEAPGASERRFVRIVGLRKDAHNVVLPVTLQRTLPELVPARGTFAEGTAAR
jgi:hypothetical protein